MDKSTVKNILSFVVGAGVGRVIDDVVDATAPESTKLPIKILRKIGSWGLGWFISDCVCEKFEKTFDELAETVEKAKEAVEKEVNEENEPDISVVENEDAQTLEVDTIEKAYS